MSARIVLCASQVPFVRGGAEMLVDSLAAELARRDFAVEVVRLPFAWSSRRKIFESALAWRLLDLTAAAGEPIDLVIATRFPSYCLRHPNKVVWLIHQLRQVYDLLGTGYSDFSERDPRDRKAIEMVRAMDRRTLAEARRLYTIAGNTTARLARFNGLDSTPLYPPPPHDGAYRTGETGDFLFAAGRLDPLKRFDLLVEAMAHAGPEARAKIAGTGPEEERLRRRISELGLGDRVELLGWVEDDHLLELYASCRGVFYAPYDEDYGYVTVEAMKSGKPVLTAADSGAVLELVEDGVSGFVCPPGSARAFGERARRLLEDAGLAREMGERGRRRVADIGWDRVIEALTETL